ncbi:MAG TPA: glycosyltransferase family 4 protein [Terriglobia bacterium]|nr:glycosyltransferase family 4 protein [Terriglobia bacterium]
MPEDRYRVLFVASHPVQYQAPLFRRMAEHPRLDIQVAYCSLVGAEAGVDPEFGVEVKWDVPLLEGYPWVHVPNRSPWPGLGRFLGLANPGLWKLIASGGYDAVVIYTGYACLSFWIALAAAKFHRKALLFGTDAHQLAARDGKSWKMNFKRLLWPRLFRLADVVIVPSNPGKALMRSLGIPEERLVVTPYVVDNGWWKEQAAQVDRSAVRRAWGVPDDAPVALFCAKLQPWKRPLDLLRAFARANVSGSHLVYAGEGPLRPDLEFGANALGITERVHFLGFVNQSHLPAVYCASDLLVLPSEYEPFGVVVNEAMLCGCAAVVSDRVGAGHDLISPARNGYLFPGGNVTALAAILGDLLSDGRRLQEMGEAARGRMTTWSPAQNVQGLLQAVGQSVAIGAHQ